MKNIHILHHRNSSRREAEKVPYNTTYEEAKDAASRLVTQAGVISEEALIKDMLDDGGFFLAAMELNLHAKTLGEVAGGNLQSVTGLAFVCLVLAAAEEARERLTDSTKIDSTESDKVARALIESTESEEGD